MEPLYVIQMPSGRYYAGESYDRSRECDMPGYTDNIEEAYKVEDYSHLEFLIKNWPHIFGGSKIEEVEE